MQMFEVYIGRGPLGGELRKAIVSELRDFIVALSHVPRVGEYIVHDKGAYKILHVVHLDGEMTRSPILFV